MTSPIPSTGSTGSAKGDQIGHRSAITAQWDVYDMAHDAGARPTKAVGRAITQVVLEDDQGVQMEVAARTFIDGTYEGDLAARAEVNAAENPVQGFQLSGRVVSQHDLRVLFIVVLDQVQVDKATGVHIVGYVCRCSGYQRVSQHDVCCST